MTRIGSVTVRKSYMYSHALAPKHLQYVRDNGGGWNDYALAEFKFVGVRHDENLVCHLRYERTA